MDRRTFLKATGACAATTATASTALAASRSRLPIPAETNPKTRAEPSLSAPALIKDILELRLSMPWSDNLAGPSDQLRKLVMNLKSATDGRIRIEIKQKHSSAATAFQADKADLYFGPLNTHENAPKAALYFTGLPHKGGLSAANLEAWTSMTGAGQPLDELGAHMDFKPLLAGHLGEQPGLWSKTPIQSMADLHGRKVALTGAPEDIMRAFGAHPVKVPMSSLQSALANGTIDVAECGSFHIAMSLKLHSSANYVAKGVFNPEGTALTLTIAKPVWETLSRPDQAIFAACAGQSYRKALTENRALETPLSVALREHNQIKLNTIATTERNQSWERICDTFLAHISSSNDLARRINASYTAFKNLAV